MLRPTLGSLLQLFENNQTPERWLDVNEGLTERTLFQIN